MKNESEIKDQPNSTSKDKVRTQNFIIQQSQIPPGTIKPRHLVAQSSPTAGDTYYSDGTNFQVNPLLSVDITNSKLYIGTGLDTNLYREGSNSLRTDDFLTVGGDIIVVGDIRAYTSTKGLTLVDRDTSTVYRLKISSGVLGIEAV